MLLIWVAYRGITVVETDDSVVDPECSPLTCRLDGLDIRELRSMIGNDLK